MELSKEYFDQQIKATKEYLDRRLKANKNHLDRQLKQINAQFKNTVTKDELDKQIKLIMAKFGEMVTKDDLNERADELKGIMLLKGDLLEIQKQISRLDRRTDEDVKALAKDVRLLKQQSGMVLRDAPRKNN